MTEVEESLRSEPSGWRSIFEQISSSNDYKIFSKEKYEKKNWENTCIRTLTSWALLLRASFAIRAFLRLAISLILLSLSTTFTKIEFLEALGDLSIVDSVILKTICFNVMYQLTWTLLPFSYLGDFKILLWIRPVMHVGVTARCGYATGLRN